VIAEHLVYLCDTQDNLIHNKVAHTMPQFETHSLLTVCG